MTDIVERLRGPAPHMIGPLMDEAADEIERLMAEHDDYVIRANANVCELNREIERLRMTFRGERNADLARENADDRRDDGTVIAVGGEPGASAGSSE